MRNTIPGGVAVLAALLAVAGCSSASSNSKVSIDGQDVSGSYSVTCAKQGNAIALTLADENNGKYGKFSVGATLNADGKTVSAVTLAGSKGGVNGGAYALAYGQAGGMSSAGHADVTVSGKKYTVKGEGTSASMDMSNMGMNMSDDGTMTQSFDIVFACDNVIQ
ncbi:lipoprotein LpqH [Smaragdicoccus niigatensis]|uniref:lipoprotein LpqH n=1 Tax=Smaragdicoccus niigatensis TaxID=359359 RepID=UPI00037B10B9|nr:lipoprotein LpqH [Smaragdicoccus niigatensis]